MNVALEAQHVGRAGQVIWELARRFYRCTVGEEVGDQIGQKPLDACFPEGVTGL